jgi:hypothetical protein
MSRSPSAAVAESRHCRCSLSLTAVAAPTHPKRENGHLRGRVGGNSKLKTQN